MSYSTLLYYRGYAIIVEGYIYKLAIDSSRSFLTMDDIKKRIDYLENSIKKLKNPNETSC